MPTATFMDPARAESGSAAAAGSAVGPAGQEWPGAAGPVDEASPGADLAAPLAAPTGLRRPAPGGMGLIIVMIFLVPYAICATLAAAYFYYQLRTIPNPLEALPDLPGSSDKPGASRKGSATISYDRYSPDMALPAKLQVPLHGTIQVGDLAVTPVKIEERRIVSRYENSDIQGEESSDPALVLTLQLHNTSKDDYFAPVDAAFYIHWTEGDSLPRKPYTFLEVGSSRFYGGAIDKWVPRHSAASAGDEEERREYIEGQENYDHVLAPGETMKTIICTDPDDKRILKAVKRYPGQMVWRVQVRRGLVKVPRGLNPFTWPEVSACAVVGVVFTAKDIETH